MNKLLHILFDSIKQWKLKVAEKNTKAMVVSKYLKENSTNI